MSFKSIICKSESQLMTLSNLRTYFCTFCQFFVGKTKSKSEELKNIVQIQIPFFVQDVILHVDKNQNVNFALEKKGKKLYNKVNQKNKIRLKPCFFKTEIV